MAGGRTFKVIFDGDVEKLRASTRAAGGVLQEVEEHAGGVTKALGNIATTAAGFVLGQAITAAPGYLMDAARGAAEDEAATMRLEQALRNAGGAFDEHLAKVNERIDVGAKLAFSDDDIRDSFQTLLAATGDVNEALARQKTAMDLARGAGIPLDNASRLLGKVTEENVEQFRRLGITIGEGATEAEALAIVQAKFAGQADTYAQSTAGQFEAAQIQMAEAQETIGTALMPLILALATVISTVLPQAIAILTPAIESIGAAVGFVVENWDLFLPLIVAVGAGIVTILVPSLVAGTVAIYAQATAWAVAAAAMIAANAPVLLIAAGVAALIAVIVLLVQHWDTVVAKAPILGAAVDAVRDAFEAVARFIVDDVVPALQEMWQFFDERLLPILQAAVTLYLLPLQLAFEAVKIVVAEVLLPAVQALWGFFNDFLLPILALALNLYLTPLKVGFDTARTAVDLLKDAASTLWTFFNDSILPILQSVTDKIDDVLTPALDAGKTAIGLFKDAFIALRDSVQWVIDKVQALIDKIKSIPKPDLGSIDLTPGFDIPGVPGFASGMWKVPGPAGAGDVFPAMLTPGEMVLPVALAERVRAGRGGGGHTFVANIRIEGNATPDTLRQIERGLDEWFERRMAHEFGLGATQWGAV